MQLMKVDPRALKDNPDNTRQSKSTPQADALLLATIKAVGVIQPPVIFPEAGGNGYVIEAGHRRTRMAIAAGLEEIDVIVVEAANDNGAMRSMVENIAREPLNPVDQWRGIERLVALGWTEEAIAVALALPVRQIRKLRLLANVLPSMLDQMAKGDMPNEQQLRTIAAASSEEQKEVWKAHKPKKGDTAAWWQVANGLSKTRMYARDASFGDDLRLAYGIEWAEDLFGPADEDNRYTTNVEAFLGAQQEWMASNLPKKGAIVEVNNWGQPELPKRAERVYGKPAKGDCTAMYLDRDGKVQSVHYRMPELRKTEGRSGLAGASTEADDGTDAVGKTRPEVTQKGQDMIGDFRTDALHEALARAPIEDDMLMALLVMAFAGTNVRVDSGANDTVFGPKRFQRHVARLYSADGRLSFDMDSLRVAARSVLIDVLSCRRGMSNSGIVSRIAGNAIGADGFLPNMGTEDFLLCLSRQALEAAAKSVNLVPRARVRETRAALVDHFAADAAFVLPAALFAPDPKDIAALMKHADDLAGDDSDGAEGESFVVDERDPTETGHDDPAADPVSDAASDEEETAYGIAAE
ncbi:ParB/RepB/Spo0J family partition protein [Rhizobium sp. BK077]|uniref:ParB/RepB/Spo0J family partition protein n=1 Tax=unclassified Rhizobium TaxID=2613769 RepID=UPI00160D7EFC|nr:MULTISPECIES: ParB/RepB/Spo0J family partition protein [unclassified Rhizobium]MBB3302256.1 ParB/RepB/Spo0J family partition protein [Rhizobium sp. BK112]MBB3371378.1 ParB/RepB/Spo0J family partition protein [Rhizobium sp. BK077]MBB4182133.1 ParB/RepB/Spo0J family partition protein [Rhizobium sp. BK109]MBB4255563.1 ParB/RepB/Spo0J family partition protein [Rhizobium sp. BK008]